MLENHPKDGVETRIFLERKNMITTKTDDKTKIFELSISGSVSKKDFNEVAKKMDDFVAKHGKIKILKQVEGVPKISPAALLPGIEFGLKNVKNISHIAFTTDMKARPIMEKVSSILGRKLEVKGFSSQDSDAARAWLKNPKP